jgi:hypothetical protein
LLLVNDALTRVGEPRIVAGSVSVSDSDDQVTTAGTSWWCAGRGTALLA